MKDSVTLDISNKLVYFKTNFRRDQHFIGPQHEITVLWAYVMSLGQKSGKIIRLDIHHRQVRNRNLGNYISEFQRAPMPELKMNEKLGLSEVQNRSLRAYMMSIIPIQTEVLVLVISRDPL